jgi:tetratricopeptide (TPR) repeat protein
VQQRPATIAEGSVEAAVKLSTLGDYREYERAFAANQLADARDCLLRCLRLPAVMADPATRAYLEQQLGNVLFDLGDTDGALERLRSGVEADPTSPLVTFRLAKFLAVRLGRYSESLDWCEQSRRRAVSTPHQGRDIPAATVLGWIAGLEVRSYTALGDYRAACARLIRLVEDRQFDPEHTIVACEILLTDSSSRPVAQEYLRKLVERVESSDEDLSALSKQIRRMLRESG